MVNYIWAGIMLISIVFGLLTGRAQEVSDALFKGAIQTTELAVFLFGTMAFFSGLMKIAEKSGITRIVARIFSPVLKLLFPRLDIKSKAGQSVTMNISANLLGLGNAATPLGLEAMRHLNKNNPEKGVATNNMIIFVVLNTASIQLIPTTIAALRARHGATSPMDIMPAVWLTSICSLIVGVIVAKMFSWGKRMAGKK